MEDTSTRITKRAANLTAAEKETIVELVLKYSSVIENKRTDMVTAREKEEAWKAIAQEFNATASFPRSHQQIKQTYENQKKRAKKASAEDKISVMCTGGGSYVPQVGSVEEKLLAVLGNRAQPLSNPFDSDAVYHQPADVDVQSGWDELVAGRSTDLTYQVITRPNGHIEIVQATIPPMATTSTSAASTVHPAAAVSTATTSVIPPDTAGVSVSATTSVVPPPPAAAGVSNGRQWSGRRRPQLKPHSNLLAVRAEATAKISSMQDEKKAYYQAKLEMRRLEHEQRMKVLRLEEQVLQEKLRHSKRAVEEE